MKFKSRLLEDPLDWLYSLPFLQYMAVWILGISLIFWYPSMAGNDVVARFFSENLGFPAYTFGLLITCALASLSLAFFSVFFIWKDREITWLDRGFTRLCWLLAAYFLTTIVLGLLRIAKDPCEFPSCMFGPEGNYSRSSAAKNAKIGEAQKRLIELGLLKGKADGIAGMQTAEAIKTFQAELGFEQTGQLDDRTFEALMRSQSLN
jgi:hypothetical protein